MSMISEFKTFAMRGNVVDLAVGLVIGAAFGKIVTSFVDDILMPPIGMALGGVDFSNLKRTLKEAVDVVSTVTMNYGMSIQTIVAFILLTFTIILNVKPMNTMKRKEEAAVAAPFEDEQLFTEIRDLLRSKG